MKLLAEGKKQEMEDKVRRKDEEGTNVERREEKRLIPIWYTNSSLNGLCIYSPEIAVNKKNNSGEVTKREV